MKRIIRKDKNGNICKFGLKSDGNCRKIQRPYNKLGWNDIVE